MGTLYMLSGLSGSGKTTYTNTVLKKLHPDAVVVNPDEYYRIMNGDESIHKNEFEIWMAIFRTLHMLEQGGRDVIFDSNNLTVVDRKQILAWFGGFDKYVCFNIYAKYEICSANNRKRSRVVPEDILKDMFNTMETPTADEGWDVVYYIYNNEDGVMEIKHTETGNSRGHVEALL